jgi:periplasmic protein TonB
MVSNYKRIAMEKSAILTADILDIIFEGRNKEYGAYDLRRTYNKRMRISVLVMLSAILLMFLGQLFAGRMGKDAKPGVLNDIVIKNVQPPADEPPPPPPPPPVKEPPPTKMVQFTKPIITDQDVKPEEKPPEMTEIENSQIGTVNRDGVDASDIVAPPADDGNRGIIEPPKKPKDDSVFIKVEIDASYPGGMAKWQRFLQRNLDGNIPQSAINNQISGTIVIQFIVDKEGNVSNVQAISGPEELRELGVSVIKKSGKWIPAVQNGEHVKAYKQQPIIIRLSEN